MTGVINATGGAICVCVVASEVCVNMNAANKGPQSTVWR